MIEYMCNLVGSIKWICGFVKNDTNYKYKDDRKYNTFTSYTFWTSNSPKSDVNKTNSFTQIFSRKNMYKECNDIENNIDDIDDIENIDNIDNDNGYGWYYFLD